VAESAGSVRRIDLTVGEIGDSKLQMKQVLTMD
jgi:WD40 repeat protein